MPQAGDYFAQLGLTPGLYSERQLADRLSAIRDRSPDEDRLAEATLAYSVLRDPDRQRQYLGRLLDDGAVAPTDVLAECDADAAGSVLAGLPDLEAAFVGAVGGLLEGDSGVLRYSNRRRLLDLAARLGIATFEANLLIERARFRAAQRPAWAPDDPSPDATDIDPSVTETDSAPRRPGRLTRWLVAIALALLADAALLVWLLRG